MADREGRTRHHPQLTQATAAVINNVGGGVAGTMKKGPRSLRIDRRSNGFGFTLRHFIVYPPESYSLLTGDKRLGLRHGTRQDEPMDTIFVKNVHDNSSAQAAGLATGDRIISVNGEPISGKTYAQVVQLIQSTFGSLHLLVVPKEDDIIQLYFGDTAHNPETNPRPRLRSPDVTMSAGSTGSMTRRGSEHTTTATSPLVSRSGAREYKNKRHETVAGYYPNTSGCRLSLDAGLLNIRQQQHRDDSLDNSDSRLSNDSTRSSHEPSSDDSIILSRIKKSCEQKEEFLKRTVLPNYNSTSQQQKQQSAQDNLIAREFYARPQKLQKQVWPPSSPTELTTSPPVQRIDESPSRQQQARIGRDAGGTPPTANKTSQFVNTLSKIMEHQRNTSRGGYVSTSFDSDPGEQNSPANESALSRCHSEETDNHKRLHQPKLQIVSRRMKQFESGQLEHEEDRTNLYRSELARLSSKKSVPNVSTRKQEFEQRVVTKTPGVVSKDRANSTTSVVTSTTGTGRSATTMTSALTSTPILSTGLSGNRTVIVGSKHLHTEPPSDFQQFPAENVEKSHVSRNRMRSSSVDRKALLGDDLDERQRHKAVRQNSYLEAVRTTASSTVPDNTVPITTTADTTKLINRRQKNPDDEKVSSRVSYLKSNMNLDSDLADSEGNKSPTTESPRQNFMMDRENLKVIKDGNLNCKVSMVEGKRSTDRTWRQIWAILRGPLFSMHKERRDSSLSNISTSTDTGLPQTTVDVRMCNVDVPVDYTKKKNVLRLKTPTETEFLLQAEDTTDMVQWMKVIQEQQQPPGSPDVGVSPTSPHRANKKVTNLRSRSPTGQSPASKTRKPSNQLAHQPVADPLSSPKSKTWKGKVVKQFRRIQQAGSAPSSPTAQYQDGATIGVPLEDCPPSTSSEFVPMLVEHCTQVVEERGLDIVGIYRVPGNTAAVTSLTEAVNRGVKFSELQEPRWCDVNVISSLLKSFFRRLPDSLFTGELYPKFIAADKINNPKLRMSTLRKLINELPEHNLETLKHLLHHLKRVVSHSNVNKMETRNLAIVFGPTLVRTADDNMVTMVTDMSHQCRIIESLISHVDWFFSDDDVETLENMSLPMAISQDTHKSDSTSTTLLLGNIHKVEGFTKGDHSPNKEIGSKDLVSSIISAANRKMSRAKVRKQDKMIIGPETLAEHVEVKTRSTTKKEFKLEDIEREQNVESVMYTGDTVEKVTTSSTSEHEDSTATTITRIYKPDAASTHERVRKFELETKAMLSRPRFDGDKIQAGKNRVELEWQQAKRELESEDVLDVLADNPTDLSKLTNIDKEVMISSQTNNMLQSDDIMSAALNGSLKRFKPGLGTDVNNSVVAGTGVGATNTLQSVEDGCDLLTSITKTFDKKLRSLMTGGGVGGVGGGNGEEQDASTQEASETTQTNTTPPICNNTTADDTMNNMKEKFKKFEEVSVILRNKLLNEKIGEKNELRRSESLNKAEKPKINTTLRRSESLNKNERIELIVRNSKLTNSFKRGWNKEKENCVLMLKRKNITPTRSIKRRHTVGGTKDFDNIHWPDNRLLSESVENNENINKEKKKSLRTSSPDLSSSRIKAAMEEGLSIEVSLLGSGGNVLATVRQNLITPSRPQSMPPPGQQNHKLPLESHV